MENLLALHILGYGETRLEKGDLNKTILSSELTKLQAVIDNVYAFTEKADPENRAFVAISIVKDINAVYVSEEMKKVKVNYTLLNSKAIEELVAEIEAYEVVAKEAPAAE